MCTKLSSVRTHCVGISLKITKPYVDRNLDIGVRNMENFMKRNMECEHREMDCTKKVMFEQEVDESTTNNKDVWKKLTYCTKPRLLETGPEDHDEMKFKNNTLFEDT